MLAAEGKICKKWVISYAHFRKSSKTELKLFGMIFQDNFNQEIIQQQVRIGLFYLKESISKRKLRLLFQNQAKVGFKFFAFQ